MQNTYAMKTLLRLLSICLVVFLLVSCEDDDPSPQVDENGLTKEITDLVPQEIIDEMERLGMPINGGGNPPVIEGSYLASPFILVSSNRTGDTPGHKFANYEVTFSRQNNDELTVEVDYENSVESGSGLGSFIVGDENEFSVFVEVNSLFNGASPAKFTHVLSGTLAENGIEDFYFANFMIDDMGDPQEVWIENGEGRVIYDQDGFSEKR